MTAHLLSARSALLSLESVAVVSLVLIFLIMVAPLVVSILGHDAKAERPKNAEQ